jgi:hypothetical protein
MRYGGDNLVLVVVDRDGSIYCRWGERVRIYISLIIVNTNSLTRSSDFCQLCRMILPIHLMPSSAHPSFLECHIKYSADELLS